MILDTLENIGKYASLNPLFPKVVEYLQNTDLMAQEPGRVNIDGNKLFVNHNVVKGKMVDDARMETHNAMIDIQIPLSCAEVMGYTPRQYLPKQNMMQRKTSLFIWIVLNNTSQCIRVSLSSSSRKTDMLRAFLLFLSIRK